MDRSLTAEQDRLSNGISKCKLQRASLGEQTVLTCPSSENSASSSSTVQINSDDLIGKSNLQNKTDQNGNNSQEHERPPVHSSQSNGVPCESSDKPRVTSSAGGGEKTQRPPGTPLRLRRLPASFWQEPNIPKDPSGKLMPTGDVCFGSCFGCQLHRPPFHNDAPFGYFGDYGLRSKYLDPVSAAAFPRPGHSFASISKFSGGDPLELAYLDAASVVPWRQGAASFPSAHPLAASSGDLRPVFAVDRPGSSGRTMLSATAALYGHMMRRSLHGNYHHSNDVLTEHLTSPIVSDDLWRLLPNRPLMNDFSKRFHPYL